MDMGLRVGPDVTTVPFVEDSHIIKKTGTVREDCNLTKLTR
jgi:hypothetical protein